MSTDDSVPLDPPPGELLGAVLDRMAHQLKNPLQAVTVNLEVVRMRVSKNAPEVWPTVERFAEAVDGNARLLHRRLELALAMARRTTEDPVEAQDLRGLVEDLVGALRMGEESPEVSVVGAERGEAGATCRTGYLVELLVRLLDAARSAASGETLEIRVTASDHDGRVILEGPGGDDGRPPALWGELAARAGVALTVHGDPGGVTWRVELPRA